MGPSVPACIGLFVSVFPLSDPRLSIYFWPRLRRPATVETVKMTDKQTSSCPTTTNPRARSGNKYFISDPRDHGEDELYLDTRILRPFIVASTTDVVLRCTALHGMGTGDCISEPTVTLWYAIHSARILNKYPRYRSRMPAIHYFMHDNRFVSSNVRWKKNSTKCQVRKKRRGASSSMNYNSCTRINAPT